MLQSFDPGDFLVFQLESGYGLLRVLSVDEAEGKITWHLAAYRDLFMDVEAAENAIDSPQHLTVEIKHLALTDRAFESTQVAKLVNVPLNQSELEPLRDWNNNPHAEVSDRSIRLLLGLR